SACASSRWRLPPKTVAAEPIACLACSPSPAMPSSPMPTMDSQRSVVAWSARDSGGIVKHSILILGGTAEARKLAERLSGDPRYRLELSLAGRTLAPAEHAVPLRIGGFGGAAGLADYLRANRIAMLVDATHPYAAQISANAAAASRLSGVPLLALRRAPWQRQEGDRWHAVANVAEAVAALGDMPRRVFLTLGRQ